MTRTPFPRKQNNAGLVTTTGGNDLLHTLSVVGPRSARITKIMAYNPGANATLQFGTLNRNPAGAAFVALLPILVAIGPLLDTEWTEEEIPAVEWMNNTTPTAAVGRTGDIYVLASAAGVVITIELEEFGG